jgi:tRNA dimethylallyltransferase
LYIKALIYGLFPDDGSDPAVRRRLKQLAETDGGAALYRRLVQVDRAAAGNIHPNDTYRVIRALEVFEVTGQPLTVFQERHGFREQRFTTLKLGLYRPRAMLYARINQRVDHMMEQGFVDEVRRLLARGYNGDLKSMRSLGYRHMCAFLRSETTLERAVETMKRDHRRYAKRQLTWFHADPSINWIHPQQVDAAADLIRAFHA